MDKMLNLTKNANLKYIYTFIQDDLKKLYKTHVYKFLKIFLKFLFCNLFDI